MVIEALSSDLVVMLRGASKDERLSTGQLYADAAAEIERLSAALVDARHLLGWCFSRSQHGISSFKGSERGAALSDICYHTEKFRDYYDPQRKLKVSKDTQWMGQSP